MGVQMETILRITGPEGVGVVVLGRGFTRWMWIGRPNLWDAFFEVDLAGPFGGHVAVGGWGKCGDGLYFGGTAEVEDAVAGDEVDWDLAGSGELGKLFCGGDIGASEELVVVSQGSVSSAVDCDVDFVDQGCEHFLWRSKQWCC
jgi:hypothetical protein